MNQFRVGQNAVCLDDASWRHVCSEVTTSDVVTISEMYIHPLAGLMLVLAEYPEPHPDTYGIGQHLVARGFCAQYFRPLAELNLKAITNRKIEVMA